MPFLMGSPVEQNERPLGQHYALCVMRSGVMLYAFQRSASCDTGRNAERWNAALQGVRSALTGNTRPVRVTRDAGTLCEAYNRERSVMPTIGNAS